MGDIEADQIDTFMKVLKQCDLVEAKLQALEFLLGLTGSDEGLEVLYKNASSIFITLVSLTYHTNQDVALKAANVMVNISAEAPGVHLLTSMKFPASQMSLKNNVCDSKAYDKIFPILFDHMLDETSHVAGCASMVLANISRSEDGARLIYDSLENAGEVIETVAPLVLRTLDKYDHVSSVLANLSQLEEVRKIFLEPHRVILENLLTMVDYYAVTRRTAVISIIRNLCLSMENHEFLLSPAVDILPRLLLPLAGPEEFDDDDNEKLPLDLQYLPLDKKREPEASIRKMLLEILMQLCATKFGREVIRKHNSYVILRELHKWETDEVCLESCEDLVNIIIRTEEEIGVDNLKAIEVPPDLIEKFNQM